MRPLIAVLLAAPAALADVKPPPNVEVPVPVAFDPRGTCSSLAECAAQCERDVVVCDRLADMLRWTDDPAERLKPYRALLEDACRRSPHACVYLGELLCPMSTTCSEQVRADWERACLAGSWHGCNHYASRRFDVPPGAKLTAAEAYTRARRMSATACRTQTTSACASAFLDTGLPLAARVKLMTKVWETHCARGDVLACRMRTLPDEEEAALLCPKEPAFAVCAAVKRARDE